MGRLVDNTVLDAALNQIADNGNEMRVCETEPASYAAATTNKGAGGVSLASYALTTGTAGADYAIAEGDTNGRKLTVSAQTGANVDVSGTADHLAIVDTIGSVLLYVTTVTSQAITSGGTVDTTAWDIEFRDPTA